MKHFLLICFLLQISIAFANDTSTLCHGKRTVSGEKHGIWICKENDTIIKKERYKNGLLLSYIIYNNKGEIIETRTKKGKIKKYEPCGCY